MLRIKSPLGQRDSNRKAADLTANWFPFQLCLFFFKIKRVFLLRVRVRESTCRSQGEVQREREKVPH